MVAMAKDRPTMATYDVHAKFGHINEKVCRENARHHRVAILVGSSLVCEACAIAKARQKNATKTRQ